MLDEVERRLVLASFALLVGSFLVPQPTLAAPLLTRAEISSGIACADPAAPFEDHDLGVPAEEIAPESIDSDPKPHDAPTGVAPTSGRLRVLAARSAGFILLPREEDVPKRRTVPATERGPPLA